MPKNESFSSYLQDLKLSKFSDWTIKLKMRFKLYFKFSAQAIFSAAKKDTPLLWKIYSGLRNFLFILHYKYRNNLYLWKMSWNERICEI
jgi:hypothetical protein